VASRGGHHLAQRLVRVAQHAGEVPVQQQVHQLAVARIGAADVLQQPGADDAARAPEAGDGAEGQLPAMLLVGGGQQLEALRIGAHLGGQQRAAHLLGEGLRVPFETGRRHHQQQHARQAQPRDQFLHRTRGRGAGALREALALAVIEFEAATRKPWRCRLRARFSPMTPRPTRAMSAGGVVCIPGLSAHDRGTRVAAVGEGGAVQALHYEAPAEPATAGVVGNGAHDHPDLLDNAVGQSRRASDLVHLVAKCGSCASGRWQRRTPLRVAWACTMDCMISAVAASISLKTTLPAAMLAPAGLATMSSKSSSTATSMLASKAAAPDCRMRSLRRRPRFSPASTWLFDSMPMRPLFNRTKQPSVPIVTYPPARTPSSASSSKFWT
jgi:hypothetical protein